MSLKSLFDNGETIYRVLAESGDNVVVIDCLKRTMPVWLPREKMSDWQEIEEQALHERTGVYPVHEDTLSKNALASAHKRYSMIACIVPVVADKKRRAEMIAFAASNGGVSKQTVRKYMCLFLVYQTVSILAPIEVNKDMVLSQDQKNMRWALNKFYYTCRQNNLRTAFLYLLKEKYTDENGLLKAGHPSFYQFRYFYRKTRNEQNFST